MMAIPPRRGRWMFLIVLLACLVVSLFWVIYPIYVIRPFRAQGARELAAALVVSRFRSAITVISAAVALAALAWRWPAWTGKWRRIPLVTGTVFVCALAWLARVNIYELMFHPVGQPSFTAAQQVKIDKDDKVIAVKIGGQARAYPIRTMGYHHIVNDVVDKLAIVATY